MAIVLLGQNHRSAPIELRETLAFTEPKRERASQLLASQGDLREGVILSTCNRVELYGVCEDAEAGQRALERVLEQVHGVEAEDYRESLYHYEEANAVRHLFRVAGGLDSMVLGEGQILHQVKDAYTWARSHDLTQEVLHRVFNLALNCGKRVRTETRVGEGAVSVAFAGVELARKIFSDIVDETVLLVGAGETGQTVAQHLQTFGVRDLRVTNRTEERGRAVATQMRAAWIPFESFPEHLAQASIVVTATASPEPVIDDALLAPVLAGRGRRPLFLIDLGVPRDIAPDVGRRAGVFLYNVDDLEGIVEKSSSRRRKEAERAETIIEAQLIEFLEWYRSRAMTPTLAELHRRMETLRQSELEAARTRLTPEAYKELDRVTRRLVNKMLHTPTVQMKHRAAEGRGESYVEQIRDLFGLDEAKSS